MTLCAENVSWAHGNSPIVSNVSLRLPEQGVLGLVGPNGSGKSSLLRLLAGLRPATTGTIYLDDTPLAQLKRRDVGRRIALVEQHANTDVALTVEDIVALGRLPHRGAWSARTTRDESVVAQALERTGLAGRADQLWSTLSGGERQRVQIARALAQEPQELVLDEPSNHLDIRHQLELMRLLPTLGTRVIVALHDLNQAAAFCDQIAVMQAGMLVAQGAPGDVLNTDLIREVFGVDARIVDGPEGRRISFF